MDWGICVWKWFLKLCDIRGRENAFLFPVLLSLPSKSKELSVAGKHKK